MSAKLPEMADADIAAIEKTIHEFIRPHVTQCGKIVRIHDIQTNLIVWRRRIETICRDAGVSLSIPRNVGNRGPLWVRIKPGPEMFQQRPQWMIGTERTFSGCEYDGRKLCEVWNSEAKARREQHRFRVVLDGSVQTGGYVCHKEQVATLTSWTHTVKILKHEKGYVTTQHVKGKTTADIRAQIWALSELETCLIDCERQRAYKIVESQRLRYRDRVRRFRFKVVDTPEGKRLRVLRMVDRPLYDLGNWQVEEERQFHGHARNRWRLLARLNRDFAKNRPQAAIYETSCYTETTFTIKRVR